MINVTACPRTTQYDEVEMAKCHLDDLLLFRMVALYIVAKLGRDARLAQERATNLQPVVKFLMEQPAAPQHMPEVASVWRTEEWQIMKEYLNLDLDTFNQGAYGGMAVKPTSLALNMEFTVPEFRGPPKAFLKSKGHQGQEDCLPEETNEDPTKRKRLVLMLPPKILVRLGLVKEGEMWLVERALRL